MWGELTRPVVGSLIMRCPCPSKVFGGQRTLLLKLVHQHVKPSSFTRAHSMEDSNDNQFPEFILDDQILAFLVEEESKFIRNTQPADTSPPLKCQKTTASSRPIQRDGSIDAMEELPDISVQMDGTYALQVTLRQPPEQTSQPQMVRTTSSPSYSQLQRRPSSQPRGETPLRACSVTTPARGISLPSRPPTSTCVVQTPTPFSSQNTARSQSGPSPHLNDSVASGVSEGLLADLCHQVEEVRVCRSTNPCIQTSLSSSVKATNECSPPYKGRKSTFRRPLMPNLLKKGRSQF